jgi:putative ABC transport system permease protein
MARWREVFLALRELIFARGRFALMGLVVVLIAMLMVLLSGLSVGLANDGVSGLQRLPVTSLAFQKNVAKDSAFSRSVVPRDAAATWAAQEGIADAAPLGNTLVNARSNRGLEIDLALFGVEPGSFIDPEVATGARLGKALDEVVISATAAESGIKVGDVLTVEPLGTKLRVAGILKSQNTFGHVEIAYLPLRTWQEIRAGVQPGDEVPPRVYTDVTAIAVAAKPGARVDLAAGDRAAGTTSMTKQESYGASPGYSAETSTLQLIEAFLYVISALVVGAFFTVLTIQRKQEIAVMRAMGAGTRYLLRDSMVQSVVLLVASTAVGIGLGLAAGAAISSSPIPFALEAGPIAVATVLMVVLGMVGAAVAVVRIARVDPLIALGGNR